MGLIRITGTVVAPRPTRARAVLPNACGKADKGNLKGKLDSTIDNAQGRA